MTYSQLKRTVTEVIVRRTLNEMKRDPKRSIRKLVDLGNENIKGRFWGQFLRTAQKMLSQEDSPYYIFLQNIINTVDPEILLTFGMNLGWNSLTEGASKIRAKEAESGFNIPWSLTFHLKDMPGCLDEGEYFRLIHEGRDLGIRSYFLFTEDIPSVQRALRLATDAKDSAFCLLLPSKCRVEEQIGLLEGNCHNIMFGVDGNGLYFKENIRFIRERKLLYLIFRRFSNQDDIKELLSGKWMEEMHSYLGMAVLFISEGTADMDAEYSIYSYALNARMEQRYPTLLLDFYPDTLYADLCISDDECFMGVLPDGTLTEYKTGKEAKTEVSVKGSSLLKLLQRFPKYVRGPEMDGTR